ncbi:MAG: thiolase domain-containing protein [Thermoprotei archaeon]|nr:MAG: thiolase domain-containing protein [Thermoprotei archaeon]
MRKVYVVGGGAIRIGEHWTFSLRDLMVHAAEKAIEDAGIDKKDVEAIYVGNMSSGPLQGQEHLGPLLATWLGVPGVAGYKVEAACASGGAALHNAFLAVASGLYSCVLALGVEKMSDALTADLTSALIMADDQEYVAFTGTSFVGLNALVYRAYMERFRVRQEDIALFAVHDHKYAVNNPYAQFRREISVDDVLSSPLVADPIRLFECAPIGDGAAALILCSEEFTNRLKTDVLIELAGSAVATDIFSINNRDDLLNLKATRIASERALKMANVDIKDVDVLEVHDAFTILGVLHLEDLGLAKKGEGWKLVKEGEIEVGGKIPTNTMGGLKARGHPVGATGMYQALEILTQLRGEAGKNQVEDAEVGLAQNVGGLGGTVTINVFRRVR